jgi:hypothetical protein
MLAGIAAGGYYWWTVKAKPAPVHAGLWSPVTAADARSAAAAVEGLRTSKSSGGTRLSAAEAVAYLIQETAHQLPAGSSNVEAMITSDELHVRAVMPLRELGAERALGPLASMIGVRDTVELAGRVGLIRPGLAQMHVTGARIHDLALPKAVIPKLIQQIRRSSPEGIASDAFPIPLPNYIDDIRIADDSVTLYKNVK